jgi:hypothetical protein
MHRKYIPFFFFALLLAFTIPWSLNLVSFDYATSVVPGWHTAIYPPLFLIDIILSVLLLIDVLGYLQLANKIDSINWLVFITHLMLTIPATILMKFPMALLYLSNPEPEQLIVLEAQFTWFAYCLFIAGQVFFAFYFFKTKRLIGKSG